VSVMMLSSNRNDSPRSSRIGRSTSCLGETSGLTERDAPPRVERAWRASISGSIAPGPRHGVRVVIARRCPELAAEYAAEVGRVAEAPAERDVDQARPRREHHVAAATRIVPRNASRRRDAMSQARCVALTASRNRSY
jgi:hypothetical protein